MLSTNQVNSEKSQKLHGPTVQKAIEAIILLIAPFAPHLAEEFWKRLAKKGSVFEQSWPRYDPEAIKKEIASLVVQINGKVRSKVDVPTDATDEKIKEIVFLDEKVQKWIKDKSIKKVIVVPGKIVNIVIE